mmetsp:Transcript_57075/g.150400  ORF Transcript_57075/g.150400 Transcript_57075/m.150400 type:complete len:153 (+) Transcript_57075:3-461(+)
MGKAAKKKKADRSLYNPYGRSTTRITDLCDLMQSATAGKLGQTTSMDDEEEKPEENRKETTGDSSEGEQELSDKQVTRGSILQRHKREWKVLRKQLEDLKAHKRAMGAATLEKKIAKKDVAKEIKTRTEQLTERHKKELAEFDEQQKNSMNL